MPEDGGFLDPPFTLSRCVGMPEHQRRIQVSRLTLPFLGCRFLRVAEWSSVVCRRMWMETSTIVAVN